MLKSDRRGPVVTDAAARARGTKQHVHRPDTAGHRAGTRMMPMSPDSRPAQLAELASDRHYGAKVGAVEPGGAEVIPLAERHGRPLQLLWTWTSPNMEFATIFVGILGVLVLQLNFWATVSAIVIGSALGGLTHGVLSSWGPSTGFSQMVLSRRAFGFLGNILPAGINWLVAGVGWFAVNSVSGGLALSALTGLNKYLCLVVVVALMLVLAYFGHNLIQAFERYAAPLLTVIFVVGGIVILSKAKVGGGTGSGFGGSWWILLGATFGYSAGWNPYASDYTRYLPPGTGWRAGLWAGLGNFGACTLLEIFGAAAATLFATGAPGTPGDYTGTLPTWLGQITLLGITLGAIAANAVNVYSSAISFSAMGIRLRTAPIRAVMAVVMGLAGFVVAAIGIDNIGSYENFLLVIAYWVGPWLGVVLADRILRRFRLNELVFADRTYRNWAGPIAMVVAGGLSIWLFSAQSYYRGLIAGRVPGLGDLTFEVGFVLAFALYALLYRRLAAPIAVAGPDPAAAASRRVTR